jgi:hypothetical protein
MGNAVPLTGDVLARYPLALSLLALWERPWSPNAQRFAYHALRRAYYSRCMCGCGGLRELNPLEAA